MPGNLLDTDIYFPTTQGKNQDQINREVLDYLYMLQEQLRYSFGNIGVGNFNDAELTALSVMINKPIYAAIEDLDGNLTQLSIAAGNLDLRLTDAEGDITAVTAAAGELYLRLTDAEGNITAVTATAEGLDTRISDAEGSLAVVTETAQALLTRMTNAEGDLTELAATADGLTARITGAESDITTLTATASGLSATVTSLGDNMSHTLRLGADGMTVYDAEGKMVQIAKGCLRLSGSITWDDIDDNVENYIDQVNATATGASSTASSAWSAALSAADTAEDAWLAANTAQGIINQWGYNYYGTTYIDGNQLMTGTVTASKLQGGTVSLLSEDGNTPGGINIVWTDTYDYGLDFYTKYGGIRLSSAGNLYLSCPNTYNHTGANILMGYDATISINAYTVKIGEYINSNIYPIDNSWNLGAAAYRWKNIFALNGAIQTSDQRLKKDIEDIPQKYLDMLMRLRPVRYRNIEGTFGRYHVGFVAQEVKAAMDELGIDSTEFGGYVADVDEDGNPVYMLRYEEFSGILWGKSQELTRRVSALEERVEALEGIA